MGKLTGKAKQMAGKATHNKKLEAKGKIEEEMAEFRQKAKDTMERISERFKD